MEEDIVELADSIYREKVLRARRMEVGRRVETGIELFENAVCVMRSGVRHQFPDADETEVEKILLERLRRVRQVHEHGLYERVIMTDGKPS